MNQASCGSRGSQGEPGSIIVATALALVTLGCAGGDRVGTIGARGRPDVVLVTIDTLRADATGFAGNGAVETPVLDRLAAEGVVFTDAHAHNVVTLPSHANILTGLYPFQHGVRENAGFVLDPSIPTLATLLHDAGYVTGAFVAAFPLDRRYGLTRGFDRYDDDYPLGSQGATFTIAERRGDEVVSAARAWWEEARGQSRFLWVHLYDPHAAYEPPEPFATRYRRNLYLGEVAATDAFLAPLLAPHLDRREAPALVIVTSDHGEALGDHGELTHGLFAYESTLKVPLVVWGAGIAARRDARAARHVDIVPTVLERLGIDSPRQLPGRSLLAPASAVDTYFEAFSTALNRGWAPLRGLLRERKKYVDLPLPELYDLETDPRELVNLVASSAAAARELAAALPSASAWPPVRRRVESEESAALRSLGYAVGSSPPRSRFGPEDDPKNLLDLDRRLNRFIDLFSRGRHEEAVAEGRELLASYPASAEAYEHLSLVLRELERHGEAIAVLERGLERAAVKAGVRRQLGMALREVGRAAEAAAVLEPLAASDDADALRTLGEALTDAGDFARALEVLGRAEALAPGDPRILEARGTAELRQDHTAEARVLLERALARNDQLATAWNTLAVALYRSEGPRAAVVAWQRAIALDPKLWDAHYNLGLTAASAGEPELARESLRRFLAGAPEARYAADKPRARALLRGLGG